MTPGASCSGVIPALSAPSRMAWRSAAENELASPWCPTARCRGSLRRAGFGSARRAVEIRAEIDIERRHRGAVNAQARNPSCRSSLPVVHERAGAKQDCRRPGRTPAAWDYSAATHRGSIGKASQRLVPAPGSPAARGGSGGRFPSSATVSGRKLSSEKMSSQSISPQPSGMCRSPMPSAVFSCG